MKRKLMFLGCMVTIICFCACGKEPEHYMLEAKVMEITSLEEMEDTSEVIVKGIRKEGEKPVIKEENGNMVSGYTFSDFEITEIYKDTTNELAEGNVITILENEVYSEEENVVYHIAGYNMMEDGKEYLLFLNKASLNKSDYYVSVGVNYGTVSLEKDNRMVQRKTRNGEEADFSHYEPIWEAAKEKYSTK